jgi:hypothetical protein
MKFARVVLLAALIAMALTLAGCRTADSRMVCQHTVKFEDISEVWIVRTYEVDCDKNDYPGEATIKFRNNLDRNITIDMDGPSHYEFSIGDRRDYKQTVQPGSYNIMAQAPGLRYIPENYSCTFEGHCVYEQEWIKGTEKVNYRQ